MVVRTLPPPCGAWRPVVPTVLLALATALGSLGGPALAGPQSDLEELRGIEQELAPATERAIAATVGLRFGTREDPGGGEGSGVIVSPFGHVVTVAHNIREPFVRCTVVMPDGAELRGVTLGKEGVGDFGLVRIVDEGEWPWVEMGTAEGMRRGTPCFATGHPDGILEGRPPVLRFGTVQSARRRWLRTSCTIMPGDSGGGVFDLEGRLVGVSSRIEVDPSTNDAVRIDRLRESWERLMLGEAWDPDPQIESFHEMQDRMGMKPDYADPDEIALATGGSWAPGDSPGAGVYAGPGERTLRRAFEPAVGWLSGTIVELESRHGARTTNVLATAVDRELVVTKSSEVGEGVSCILPGGERAAAAVVGRDPETDLALVRVAGAELRPVRWGSGGRRCRQLRRRRRSGRPGVGRRDRELARDAHSGAGPGIPRDPARAPSRRRRAHRSGGRGQRCRGRGPRRGRRPDGRRWARGGAARGGPGGDDVAAPGRVDHAGR